MVYTHFRKPALQYLLNLICSLGLHVFTSKSQAIWFLWACSIDKPSAFHGCDDSWASPMYIGLDGCHGFDQYNGHWFNKCHGSYRAHEIYKFHGLPRRIGMSNSFARLLKGSCLLFPNKNTLNGMWHERTMGLGGVRWVEFEVLLKVPWKKPHVWTSATSRVSWKSE